LFTSRRFLIGLAFSAALLALFFWQVDLSETADALKSANYWWFIPAIAVYFVGVWFRAVRWGYLLGPMKRISTPRLFPVVVIGYMANNLLPVRLGELVRSYYIGEKEGVSKTAALATIIIERVFDGVALLFIALFVWPFLPLPDLLRNFSDDSGIPVGLLIFFVAAPFIIILALFLAIAMRPEFGRWLVRLLVRVVPQKGKAVIDALGMRFVGGLGTLHSPRRVLSVLALTFPIWIAEAAMFEIISYGFDMDVSFHGMLFTTSTSNLATSIPSSAGGVGPFEWGARLTLEGLDVASGVATAFTIALHVALLVPVTVLGLVFMWMQHMSLGMIARQRADSLLETPAGAKE